MSKEKKDGGGWGNDMEGGEREKREIGVKLGGRGVERGKREGGRRRKGEKIKGGRVKRGK